MFLAEEKPTELTDKRLEQAAAIAARIVRAYGDDYWPVFERIEQELEARLSRSKRLARYAKEKQDR